MKKEDMLSICNISGVYKGFLVPIFFLFVAFAQAQVISVVATDPTGAEVTAPGLADGMSFTITRSNALTPGTIVNYTITGTATVGQDFTAPLATGSVTLSAIAPSQVVQVTGIVDDNIVEGDETVVITLTGIIGSGIIDLSQNTAEAVIADNDVGTIGLLLTDPYDPDASEEGLDQGLFRVFLDKPNGTAQDVVVDYMIEGTATNGVDFNLGGAFDLRFVNDETQIARNITVLPIQDLIPETDETVVLTLMGTDNPALFNISVSNTAMVTIADNDCIAGITAPPLNGATATERCDEPSVNLDTFVTGGAASAPAGSTLRWSLFPDPTLVTQLLPAATVTASDTYYGLYWAADNSCASPALEVDLTFYDSPSAGTTTNQNACNNDDDEFGETKVDLDDVIIGEDSGDWAQTSGPSVGNIPGNNEIDFSGRPAGNYVFTYTTDGADAPCTNVSSSVTITVSDCDPCVAGNAPPVLANDAPPTDYCRDVSNNEIISLDLDDFTNSNPPAGTELRWSTLSDVENENAHLSSSTINISTGATYFGFFWDDTNNCASPVLTVSILIKSIPVLTVGEDQERCGPGIVPLTATAMVGANNATIRWFTAASGGSATGTGQNFSPNISQTTTYYVDATFNGCTTSPRVPVVATVVPQPSAGTPQNGGNASACSVADNGPTILDLDDLITGEDPGVWSFTNGPLGESITIPSNGIINFENRSDGDYVFTYTTTGAQAPCENESSVITISVNDCDVDTDLDGLFDGPEATLGTDPNNPDSDGDGINDGEEVGPDVENPLNQDGDEFIDALDSNIADADMDGVADQQDPANENPCIPNRENGICDFDDDGITDSIEIANGSDPDDPCDPNPESPACNAEVDLEVLKEVDNLNALIGDTVVFTITVNNLTDSKASSVLIGDLLESGFEYVSHSPAAEEYSADNGEWKIPLIEPRGSVVLEITANILEGGTYTNTAELLDVFQTDINNGNDSASVTLPITIPEGIDLVLEKTALSANPLVGDEVIFTIKVINASIDEAPVTNIEISDLIADDSGFVYVDSNASEGTYDEATGVWGIESLARNAEITLEIRVSVPNEGTFTNTARITRSSPADGNIANNEATVEVKVSVPTPADVGFLFNQFSPNGDGTNDVLKINRVNRETNQDMPIQYNVQIFNRYGNLVYEGNNKTDSEVWDGTWKGKEAPDGTYFYIMSLDIGQGAQEKKGWIQLIR